MMLSFIIRAIIGVIAFVVLAGLVYLAGRLLTYKVRLPLGRFCEERGWSPYPWKLLIFEAAIGTEYVFHIVYTKLLLSFDATKGLPLAAYKWIVLGIGALPLVVLLFQTKVIYFVPLLLIKILCIPLDIIMLLTITVEFFFEQSGEKADSDRVLGSEYQIVYQRQQGSAPYQTGSAQSPADGGWGGDSSPIYTPPPDYFPTDPGYSTENYQDQYRVRQSGDGYHTVQVGGETLSYSGDYAPFGAEGPIESYSSDSVPME